jgi:predicted nucleotidyltransferase
MDKAEAIRLAKEYKELVSQHLPVKALYLYGSYSKDCGSEDSDIDIAVIVDKKSDNYFDDTPLLWTLKRRISNLIEPVLMAEGEKSPLYHDVVTTGIMI